jgi:hypothetical protein
MIDKSNHLKKMAAMLVHDIWHRKDGRYIFRELAQSEKLLPTVEMHFFENEWRSARLALGCLTWEWACLENKIEDESVRKAFLRSVMERFPSADSRAEAKSFSEYLHSSELDDDGLEVLALAKHLYKRLNWLSVVEKDLANAAIHESFRKTVFALEAAKSEIHKFFEEQQHLFL